MKTQHIARSSLGLAAILAAGVAPAVVGGRVLTLDHATFDVNSMPQAPINAFGDCRGRVLDHRYAYQTYDGKSITVDSTGSFLIGELERLDQTLHMPLAAVTWSRDINLREDVSVADEFSSFTLTNFASAGTLGTGHGIRTGKAWAGKTTDQIGGVGVDTAKIPNPLTPWALEIKYSVLELESAAKLGRPIDAQKYEALKLKHQMDIDEMVYVGDGVLNVGGLLNNALVTNVSNVVNGASASPLWTNKSPAEILKDVNDLLISVWTASAFAVMPNKILIPPTQFGWISTQTVSTAGSVSILKYLLENNILKTSTGQALEIQPSKWCIGSGSGGTIGTAGTVDRMVAYTQRTDYIRYPMTMLQRTPVQYDSLFHKSTYYCRLGVVEVVYPETIGYRDGL
jgi:hypothetical protein